MMENFKEKYEAEKNSLELKRNYSKDNLKVIAYLHKHVM